MIEKFLNEVLSKIDRTDPLNKINEKEFNENLLRFGSFISIIKNKRVNQAMLLVALLEDCNTRNSFTMLNETDDIFLLLKELIVLFPVLSKSQVVKNKIQEILNDKKRTEVL